MNLTLAACNKLDAGNWRQPAPARMNLDTGSNEPGHRKAQNRKGLHQGVHAARARDRRTWRTGLPAATLSGVITGERPTRTQRAPKGFLAVR